jgi:serine/threonine protein kinase
MTTLIPEPLANPRRPAADLQAAQDWLDTLSNGACTEATFLRAVQELIRKAPDAGWDLLSLLDQYYRRGKINPEVFRTLKSQLEGQLLGATLDIEISVPLTQKDRVSRSARQTAPTPPPASRTKPIQPSPAASTATAAGTAARASSTNRSSDATDAAAAKSATAVGAASAPREITVGDVLRGRYRVKSVLGRGGTGTVFEAIDQNRLDMPNAGQRLAIKVLHSAVAERVELLSELRREFQHLQSLSHPNIVRVHDYDRDGDIAFFTMEYLSGLALSRVLSARHELPLDRSHALAIIRDVGAALAYAHACGVVHGDLNPGNVFVTDDGAVRVLDFGASHTLRRGPRIADYESTELTPIATPRYASCQLLEGDPADVRDDLYAFACLVYVLLAGRHPFGEHNAIQARTLRLKPARPHGLSGEQWRALRSGLSFQSDRRPANVEEWLTPFGLREAAPHLPALVSLLRVASPKHGRMLLPALCAWVLAMGGAVWWVTANVDSVARATTAWSSEFEDAIAGTGAFLTQLWHRTVDAADDAAPKLPTLPTPSDGKSSAPPAIPGAAPPPSIESTTRATASPPTSPSAPPPAPASSPSSALRTGVAAPRAATPVHAPSGPTQRSRIELAADAIDVSPTELTARVVVRRSGNLHGDVSFSWWTESGTAKPGHDFAPIAPREEHIGDGKGTVSLFIPVIVDAARRRPKSFFVVISNPSAGAALGAHTLAMVTIPPPD